MIVYHGSNMIVDHPDVGHSFRDLDFGRGFYVTTVREQAERWAIRKALFAKNSKPVLNEYELLSAMDGLGVRNFGDDLDSWIDFVCKCSDGDLGYQQYDIIIGNVANDKVFRVVDLYHSGVWDKDRALKEIRVYPGYDQIAFITQKAIDQTLVFTKALEVSL
ncbi:DUF3990 domain-containing protein [Porcincola sp. LCP21S3_C12]|uniref:DUF3990 domain-containing protein n=1 Tax=Porcincola sp. LCP21S3_C12 TaxID=3438798 RepID=UPI003F977EB0